jgi:protein-disulfide isomerase
VASGKVRFAYLHLPLRQIHANAERAALASLCAGRQGKFWPMHDRLFQKPLALSAEGIADHARGLRLESSQFTTCMSSEETAAVLDHHVRTASALGVKGTPTFFAAFAEPDEHARLVARIVSGPTIAGFERVLTPLLESDRNGTQAGR